MKKRISVLYIFLHTLLFTCGLTALLSIYKLSTYYSHYDADQKEVYDTYDFRKTYMKYIERLTFYIHYSDSGYTLGLSSPDHMDEILENEDTQQVPKSLLYDQDNYEFYHYCLNIQPTNFLYYVQNIDTGKVYYTPFLDKIYPDGIDRFTEDIKSNPAFFLLNSNTGKYTTNVEQCDGILGNSDLTWIIDTLSEPIPITDTILESTQTKDSVITYDHNTSSVAVAITTGTETYHYIIYTGIYPSFGNTEDTFYTQYQQFQQARSEYKMCIYLLPGSLILGLILFFLLIFQTGYHKPQVSKDLLINGVYLNGFDSIYSDVVLFTLIGILVVEFLSLRWIVDVLRTQAYSAIVVIIVFYTFHYFLLATAFFSFIRRIKSKTLFRNSFLFCAIRWLGKRFSEFFNHHKFTYWVAGFLTLFLLIQCFAIYLFIHDRRYASVFVFIFSYLLLIGVLLKTAIDYGIVLDSVKQIQEGNMTKQIALNSLSPGIRVLGDYINHITTGLSVAVEERTKSERFKIELITNVSHDIKTPLTSIINYVDLLKKEPLDQPKVAEYLDILTNKSWRLKTLIEDLVEASKASSGAIKMNPQQINLIELVKQAAGEFDDRFHEHQLELDITTLETPVSIYADGRSTYRIIDNLFSNINKYALHGTRVYIDVKADAEQGILSIKNISRDKLNITADELMERFVRGDTSRNTEGSGLGLSIARSLTTLQNGTFHIEVDGDLFKVTLTLPLYIHTDS